MITMPRFGIQTTTGLNGSGDDSLIHTFLQTGGSENR